MNKPYELRLLARRYRDGEDLKANGTNTLHRHHGSAAMIEAMRAAIALGYSRDDLFDEVAQIDIEEEDVK